VKRAVVSAVVIGAVFGGVLVAGGCAGGRPGFGDESGAAPAPRAEAGAPPQLRADEPSDGGYRLSLDAACATATAHVQRSPVFMMIVLDGSGSMSGDNKWTAAVQALDAVFDDMFAKNDPEVGVGLIVFEDNQDPHTGYPSKRDVFIGVVNQDQRDALRARIDAPVSCSGGTPTFAALSGGYSALVNLVPPAPLPRQGKKVLVLMTDGEPNGGSAEQQQCLTAASDMLANEGITTFSVGIGPFPGSGYGYDPVFMGRLASAGGAAPPSCNPTETSNPNKVCHLQITPNGKPVAQLKQEFIDTINFIRGAAGGCELNIELSQDGKPADPNKVNVIFTDASGAETLFAKDAQDGWTYDDDAAPKKVLLHGQACSKVSRDPRGKVNVLLGCATQTN
jgi:hypothetical protein